MILTFDKSKRAFYIDQLQLDLQVSMNDKSKIKVYSCFGKHYSIIDEAIYEISGQGDVYLIDLIQNFSKTDQCDMIFIEDQVYLYVVRYQKQNEYWQKPFVCIYRLLDRMCLIGTTNVGAIYSNCGKSIIYESSNYYTHNMIVSTITEENGAIESTKLRQFEGKIVVHFQDCTGIQLIKDQDHYYAIDIISRQTAQYEPQEVFKVCDSFIGGPNFVENFTNLTLLGREIQEVFVDKLFGLGTFKYRQILVQTYTNDCVSAKFVGNIREKKTEQQINQIRLNLFRLKNATFVPGTNNFIIFQHQGLFILSQHGRFVVKYPFYIKDPDSAQFAFFNSDTYLKIDTKIYKVTDQIIEANSINGVKGNLITLDNQLLEFSNGALIDIFSRQVKNIPQLRSYNRFIQCLNSAVFYSNGSNITPVLVFENLLHIKSLQPDGHPKLCYNDNCGIVIFEIINNQLPQPQLLCMSLTTGQVVITNNVFSHHFNVIYSGEFMEECSEHCKYGRILKDVYLTAIFGQNTQKNVLEQLERHYNEIATNYQCHQFVSNQLLLEKYLKKAKKYERQVTISIQITRIQYYISNFRQVRKIVLQFIKDKGKQ